MFVYQAEKTSQRHRQMKQMSVNNLNYGHRFILEREGRSIPIQGNIKIHMLL